MPGWGDHQQYGTENRPSRLLGVALKPEIDFERRRRGARPDRGAIRWLPGILPPGSAFRWVFPEEPRLHRTTIFTSLSGTTITLTTCLPETKGCVLGSASARLSSSARGAPN